MSIIKHGLRLNTKHYIAPREGIQYHLPENEIKAIDKELSAMCQKGIVRKTKSTPGDYVSPIFMQVATGYVSHHHFSAHFSYKLDLFSAKR